MTRLDSSKHGAAAHALRLLKDARNAASQLKNQEDPEALHRFRVRVRRVRAFMRVYRSLFGKRLVDKPCRKLGLLIDSTNTCRDLQVQRLWLDRACARRRLNPRARESARWMAAQLAEASDEQHPIDPADLLRGFKKATRRIRRRLDDICKQATRSEKKECDQAFNRYAGVKISKTADRLQDSITRILSHDDQDNVHDARLIAKRLRYIVEPMNEHADVGPAVADLKRLQDLLGALRDRQVLQAELAKRLSLEAGAWAGELIEHARSSRENSEEQKPTGHQARCLGLRDLIQVCEHEQAVLYNRLVRNWLSDRAERGLRHTRRVAGILENHEREQAPTDAVQPPLQLTS
jgi:CHAD domain-containing protein